MCHGASGSERVMKLTHHGGIHDVSQSWHEFDTFFFCFSLYMLLAYNR